MLLAFCLDVVCVWGTSEELHGHAGGEGGTLENSFSKGETALNTSGEWT
jgi:hypothetical protein